MDAAESAQCGVFTGGLWRSVSVLSMCDVTGSGEYSVPKQDSSDDLSSELKLYNRRRAEGLPEEPCLVKLPPGVVRWVCVYV